MWVAVLCWNGYWFLLRIVYQLEVRGGVLWWWAPLRAGQVPIGEVVAIRPSRVAVMGHVVTTRRGTIWVGLTRFDGHPPSGALPRGGCPSWRPWNASSLVRAGRSRLSSRPRSSSWTSAERQELSALRRENRRLRQDVEILKRATAFFVKETR